MNSNLIYNGDFSYGTDSWTGSGISVSNGVCSCTGDLVQDLAHAVPISRTGKYRLSFDLKMTTIGSSSGAFYIAIHPRDNNKSTIDRRNVNRLAAATQTTLANAVANGDTTITVTNATGWTAPSTANIGICDKLAWGYNRNTKYQHYASISGNVITLNAAWSQGAYAAGTKVCQFNDGATYDYWYYIAKANFPTEWTSYTADITIDNSKFMYSALYAQITTLAYNHSYQIRNLRLERLDAYQKSNWEPLNVIKTLKNTELQADLFNESGMKIRYVRDGISGNTKNTDNHYCEFQVFNSVGENIALGKNLTAYGGTVYANSVATDGIVDSQWLGNGSGTDTVKYMTFDNGFIEDVSRIKIWHYYPDGRTYYKNIVQVSTDGTNWITVYQGQKPETSAGNEIILTGQPQFYYNGEARAREFYEF